MVRHWLWEKGSGWRWKAAVNGLGAVATTVSLMIIGVSKFIHGAWIVTLVIPLLMWVFWRIHRHYQLTAAQLTLRGLPPDLTDLLPSRVVLPIGGVHRGTISALRYARSISEHVTAVYVEMSRARRRECASSGAPGGWNARRHWWWCPPPTAP